MSTPAKVTVDGLTSNWTAAQNPVIFTFTGISTAPVSLRVFREDNVPLSEVITLYPRPGDFQYSVNVAPYLLKELSARNEATYEELAEIDNLNGFGFYLGLFAGFPTTDTFFVGNAAMQAGEQYAPNLGRYTILADVSTSPDTYGIAYFATEFEQPSYWRGYPWDISIYNAATEGVVNVLEYTEAGQVNSDTYNYTPDFVNSSMRLRLPVLFSGTTRVELYIEPGIGVGDLIITEDSLFVNTEDSLFVEQE